MKKIAVMVDGGHLRAVVKRSQKLFTADLIEKVSLSCALATEEIVRILYYDCAPYSGETRLPVSKQKVQHAHSGPSLLHELARKDLFAVRQGVLKFRGYAIRKNHQPSNPLQDSDFVATFSKKAWICGLDSIWPCSLQIGLSI